MTAAPAGPTSALRVRSFLPQRLRLELEPACGDPRLAAGIGHALLTLPDVAAASVNPTTGRALIVLAAPQGDLDALLDRISVAVASALLLDPTPQVAALATTQDVPIGRDWARVVVGAAAVGALTAIRLLGGPLALASPPVAALATGAALLVGLPTFISGLKPLLRFEPPEIDTLITTATLASLLIGEAATGLIVVWLIALGELVEELTLERTRSAISDLLSVGEDFAWIVLPDGQEVKVRREEIEPGTTVVVHAGEKIPVDAVVLEGGASVNQAPITGESLPVFRNPGDEVFAGTLVLTGSLLMRATRVGEDTAIGRIIRMVEEARDVQAPIQRLADRFSRRIVPLSFLLAGGVFALTGNVLRSMTILVIACPCAAGLATPTAVSAAIASAAKRGILVKGGLHLENAGRIDAVIFDKTGTLTAGAPRVQRVVAVDDRYTPERVLALAASGELHSQHPLASAVLQHTAEREIEIPPHSEYEIIVGHGVRFAVDGARLVIGSRHMLEDFGVPVSPDVETHAARLREQGQSVLWVAETSAAPPAEHTVKSHPEGGSGVLGGAPPRGSPAQPAKNERAVSGSAASPTGRGQGPHAHAAVLGLIGVSDIIRPEARTAISSLQDAGIRAIHMITGDSKESATAVATELGIPHSNVIAEAMPEQKFDLVRRLQAQGHTVALVGDGVNDAPALAAADVGIAMGHGGADVALEAADVALAADDIRHVAETILLSRRTMRLVRQNFAFSLGINGIGVLAGAVGLLSPFAAAIVHSLSTVAVVLNSGRLLTAAPEPPAPTPPPAGGATQAPPPAPPGPKPAAA
ncbi:MAG TPA: cation-translocating P-type ATPase [Chloroflexota bacterium]|nr:cation-translocating P-type ATPase [Chloroflexota bacterium]